MQSKVFFAVGVLFALLSSSIATSADPIAAPAGSSAGYVYTESELNAKDRAGLTSWRFSCGDVVYEQSPWFRWSHEQ